LLFLVEKLQFSEAKACDNFFFSALIVAEQAKTIAAPPTIAEETVLLQVREFVTV